MAVGPGPFEQSPPTVIVAVEDVVAGVGLDEWVDAGLESLRRSTERLYLVDAEPVEVDGAPGWRLLAHHAVEGIGGVTLERWAFLHGGSGWVVSASAPTLGYEDVADVGREAASGFRLLRQR